MFYTGLGRDPRNRGRVPKGTFERGTTGGARYDLCFHIVDNATHGPASKVFSNTAPGVESAVLSITRAWCQPYARLETCIAMVAGLGTGPRHG